MDYGSFNNGRYSISIARFSNYKPMLETVSLLLKKYGYDNAKYVDGLQFNKEASYKIAHEIYQFVPKCMEHKLPDEFKNKYRDFNLDYKWQLSPEWVRVEEIRSGSDGQMNKMKSVYSLGVEGTNNYMVGNHNSGVIVKATS